MTNGLLFVFPALLLALVLLRGRFPGEARITALRARRWRQPARRAAGRVTLAGRAPWVLLPRGSALLAGAFATRPPPLAAVY